MKKILVIERCEDIEVWARDDPEEIERLDPLDPPIPYDWEIKHR